MQYTTDSVQDMLGSALSIWRKQRASCFCCDERRPILGAWTLFSPDDPGRAFVAPLCTTCKIRVANSPKARARLEAKLSREVGV